jgi:hypothetical protein
VLLLLLERELEEAVEDPRRLDLEGEGEEGEVVEASFRDQKVQDWRWSFCRCSRPRPADQ